MAPASEARKSWRMPLACEGGRARDHLARALLHQRAGALLGADAAADARSGAGSQQAHQVVVRAVADGGVEVDDLDFREGGEPAQHFERRIAFERLLAPLHELDDLAAHQVNARQDHAACLTGMPWRSSYSFSSAMR